MLERAQAVLRDTFGFHDFRGRQREVIETLLAGGDALVLMPTGGGKSLCYQLPAIVREGTGVVISPLIALMQDQVSALREAGVAAACLNSALGFDEVRRVERELVEGRLDLLYLAPERALQPRTLELLEGARIALVAIDEAHCVSQWGHDFRPEYLQLAAFAERFPGVPRVALTATADEPTREEICERLGLGDARRFVSGFDRPNIRYRVVAKDRAREQLARFIESEHAGDAGIVYCLSRRRVEETAAWLAARGHAALPYHAGLGAAARAANQRRFVSEEGVVIVATIAFGMGIDKPNVRFVAHLDLPKSIEAYYQETGRAGRDGLPADAWMAYGLQDVVSLRQMLDGSEADEARKWVERRKLDAMLGYCEVATCRRQVLLGYFGDRPAEPCGNCDVCLEPVPTWDATEPARKALSCVFRTGQRFGVTYLIDVLRGASDERIVRNGHDRVSTYGIGADIDAREWRSIFRQLIALDMVRVDVEYGTLRLAEAARPVLRGERPLELRREAARAGRRARATRASPSVVSTENAGIFEALRARRLELARERGVPPYVIFHDSTLAEMAERRPGTLDELADVSGVGTTKLERYGDAFLEVLAAASEA